jgi:hypothetical protein
MSVFRNENAAAHPFRATQQQENALVSEKHKPKREPVNRLPLIFECKDSKIETCLIGTGGRFY